MDLTLYEERLGVSSNVEGFLKGTETIVNENFDKAISYRQILLNGIDADCQYKRSKQFNKLDIWLRPNTQIDKGLYVVFENSTFLITEFVENELYPKCEIELCNNTLRWKDDLGNVLEYACIIKGSNYELDNAKGNVFIASNAEPIVIVPYNAETKSISTEQRFVFNGFGYITSSIDLISQTYIRDGNTVGLVELKLTSAGLAKSDDVVVGVADNTGNSGWGEW